MSHAQDLILRMAAIDPTDVDGVVGIIVDAIDGAEKEERERCAKLLDDRAQEYNRQRPEP